MHTLPLGTLQPTSNKGMALRVQQPTGNKGMALQVQQPTDNKGMALRVQQPTGNKGTALRVQQPSRIPRTSKLLTRVKCRLPTIPLVDMHPLPLPSRKEADSWAVEWELVWRVVLWEDCCWGPRSMVEEEMVEMVEEMVVVVEAAVVVVAAAVVDVEAKLFGESALYSLFFGCLESCTGFSSFCSKAVTSLAVKAKQTNKFNSISEFCN